MSALDMICNAIPLYNAWLFNAEVFTELLPTVRLLHIEGSYGSGKTVTAVFLCELLREKGLVSRVVSNILVRGQDAIIDYVPAGQVYYSPNLKNKDGSSKVYYGGEQLPLEDTAILWDEAGIFLKNNKLAEDVMAGLRKANDFVVMPSILKPAAGLRAFTLRKSTNWYKMQIPAWEYTWAMMQGRDGVVKGKFWLWRPHRLFGIAETQGFPEDDGGILDAISYTLGLGKVRAYQAKQAAKRQIASFDWGAGEIQSAIGEFADALGREAAYSSASGGGGRRRK